jgi:hypothetical protein
MRGGERGNILGILKLALLVNQGAVEIGIIGKLILETGNAILGGRPTVDENHVIQ